LYAKITVHTVWSWILLLFCTLCQVSLKLAVRCSPEEEEGEGGREGAREGEGEEERGEG